MVAAIVPELDGAAGWEKVNCKVLVGPLVSPVVSGLLWEEIDGAAAGWEKLKPSGPDLAPANTEKLVVEVVVVLLVWDPALLLKGELESGVVCGLVGSGLALKIGLKTASVAGLKLNSVDPKPRLWVTV